MRPRHCPVRLRRHRGGDEGEAEGRRARPRERKTTRMAMSGKAEEEEAMVVVGRGGERGEVGCARV